MRGYLDIVETILEKGTPSVDRTGVGTLKVSGETFEHDMSQGFPLLTTKKMGAKSIATELEFFIKGKTDKKWLQDRNCTIWDEWCSPAKVTYNHDAETFKKMREERDLGPIYGFQWRHFDAEYKGYGADYTGRGVDQLANLVTLLEKDPQSRRMIVTAFNPAQQHLMALPPCHMFYQAIVEGDRLNLIWYQRSVDTMLGLSENKHG